MTRINCIPVNELNNKHLHSEYREITRVAKAARPLKNHGSYKMGTGHVVFFYNKLKYLDKRTDELYRECKRRGINVQKKNFMDNADRVFVDRNNLYNDWDVDIIDEFISSARINDKLDGYPLFNYSRDLM